MLTADLLGKLRDVIRKHHTAFIARVTVEDEYLYGRAKALAESGLSPAEALAEAKRNPVPLSAAEKAAVAAAAQSGAVYVMGLGNVVEKQTGALLIEADHALRAKLRGAIADETAKNLATRQTVSELKSALGHATQDWTRNLARIAVTEKHSAMQTGVADGIRRVGGDDAQVAIIPAPDACVHCIALHTEGGVPRIFKLSELAPAGANVGKKPAQWVASTGAVHPNCGCQLVRVPTGWGFDEKGRLMPGAGGVLKKGAEVPKKRTTVFAGFPVTVEFDAGDVRRGTNRHGVSWERPMANTYGEFAGTVGDDGDPVDVYLGPNENAANVYLVSQAKKQNDGTFSGVDETKVMLGFDSGDAAKAAYLKHYNDPRFFGGMKTMPMAEFREWLGAQKEQKDSAPAPKAAGPFIGPRGGKWADAAHTVSWGKSAIPPDTTLSDGGPRTGGSVALATGAPLKPVTLGVTTAVADALRAWLEPSDHRITRDPRIYEFQEGIPDMTFVINMDDGIIATSKDSRQVVEKDNIARMAHLLLDVPRNRALPFDPEAGRVVKASPHLMAIGPQGGKIVGYDTHGKPKYASAKPMPTPAAPYKVLGKVGGGSGVAHVAAKVGAHVTSDMTNPKLAALQVPAEKAPVLEAVKEAHGLSGNVVAGFKNAFLTLSAADTKKLNAVGPQPVEGSKGAIHNIPVKPMSDLEKMDFHSLEPTWKTDLPWKKRAYGGVVMDGDGRVLLREPTGHFDGYVWTFAKGKLDAPDDSVAASAVREVGEECGHHAEIVGAIPGVFTRGDMGDNGVFMFLMRSAGKDLAAMDWETSKTTWATPAEAEALIAQTTNVEGRKRDMAILKAALAHHADLMSGKQDAVWKDPPPEPVRVPEVTARAAFSPAVVLDALDKALPGMSRSAMREALLPGPALPGSSKANARAKIVEAIHASGTAHPRAILALRENMDSDAVKASVAERYKGPTSDGLLAQDALKAIPQYDLDVIKSLTFEPKPILGQAYAKADGTITVGHGPEGTYVGGDVRHELGHVVHFALVAGSPALRDQLKGMQKTSVERMAKVKNTTEYKSPEWFEKNVGVVGKRALDNPYEYFAEHYRGYHRTVHQQLGSSAMDLFPAPTKGSANLATYENYHPEMAKIFDAHYTAALLGDLAQKGVWK